MAKTARYITFCVVLALALLRIFFVRSVHQTNATEQEAHPLMTEAVQSIMAGTDTTILMAHTDPSAEISLESMSMISQLGNLIALKPLDAEVSTGGPLNRKSSHAALQMRGHFSRGTIDAEAEMKYVEGQWIFSRFGITPGQRAQ